MAYTGELKREYQRKWLTNRRDEWISGQGGKCVRCGDTDNLEIDHIDKRTKNYPVATLWSRAAPIREAELAKCQVLCARCHTAKTIAEATKIKHGTVNTYERHRCRCDACKAAKSTKNAKRYREENV